jgi:hypothetical protein
MLNARAPVVTETQRTGSTGPRDSVEITSVAAEAVDGTEIRTGAPVRIVVTYRADHDLDVMWGFTIMTADQWVCVMGEHDPESRRIVAGEGRFSCVIPRLPLMSGTYALRIGIADFQTKLPVALAGWHDQPATMTVVSDSTMLANAQMTLHQLVTVDVEW